MEIVEKQQRVTNNEENKKERMSKYF